MSEDEIKSRIDELYAEIAVLEESLPLPLAVIYDTSWIVPSSVSVSFGNWDFLSTRRRDIRPAKPTFRLVTD